MTELSLQTLDDACRGQRAQVPASGSVDVVLAGQAARTEGAGGYVALSLKDEHTLAYLSFAPDLTKTFTTQEARAKLDYAYFMVDEKQPTELGGALTVLSGNDLLHVAEFDQLEVLDGQLVWHVVQHNDGSYEKMLVDGDSDETNDPPAGTRCMIGDITGRCVCEFSGPGLRVRLSGAFPLSLPN